MSIAPLPPLNTLITFEATVRLGSFTRAGEELNLTQSAVSRQIAQLEAALGRQLLTRRRHGLELTTAGERYLHRIRHVLEECADATAQMMKNVGENELTVACSSGIGQFWLPLHLSQFRRLHPEIKVSVIVRDGVMRLTSFEFDLGIYYLRQQHLINFDTVKLFDEEMFPVCSPEYLAGRPLFTPETLKAETLLALEDAQHQWIGWPEWFELNGTFSPPMRQALRVNHYPPLIEMACLGSGVALAWRHIIDGVIRSGRLVQASASCVSKGGGFFIITPQHRHENRATRLFKRWLIDNNGTASGN
ncbi:LysR family transcriptional regulator [Pluralibacter gergoviae]|uniref:LysR family transcriptional regulator n=1 Tax=Pluralibacter gergoviae TaxID=61647 RepID=A0A089PE46_PLUGE|nr:LysR substrate-binding domain-containing protein [Pluralibacter gergoviae]AIQ98481.1 LysR family transcriptional regulator [Pluralibacter gergoviae]EKV0917694.1 LysR family transcriptional regulator [Pluralibacter gergoviae]EKV0932590.1 LysR family transcriptional regulator [Pluralibacter gergoviae]EKV6249888.1 LysR family transcriptional regulator [Pluralibacter gergoviae]EKV9910859.1 LysR family transcriptional regulator [Pluralibacter gergoviae]